MTSPGRGLLCRHGAAPRRCCCGSRRCWRVYADTGSADLAEAVIWTAVTAIGAAIGVMMNAPLIATAIR